MGLKLSEQSGRTPTHTHSQHEGNRFRIYLKWTIRGCLVIGKYFCDRQALINERIQCPEAKFTNNIILIRWNVLNQSTIIISNGRSKQIHTLEMDANKIDNFQSNLM